MDNRIISVDMGNHFYKLIEAQRKPKLHILRYGIYPAEQFSNNISRSIRVKNLGFRTKNAILSFHHPSLMFREMNISTQDFAIAHNTIKENLQQYETDFKEELDYDYVIHLPDEESEICKATAVVVARSINRKHIIQAIALGLKPKTVDIQISAVHRIINKFRDSASLLIDLGYENTTIGIVTAAKMPILKVIPMGGQSFQNDISRLDEFLNQLQSISLQLMDFYINSEQKPLEHGILYGGCIYMPEIKRFIIKEIPLDWNELEDIHQYMPFIPDDMDLNLYGNCLGSLFWNGQVQKEGELEL